MKSVRLWFALAASALLSAFRSAQGLTAAANTYDAAVEVHEKALTRTVESAVDTRHLLWARGSTDLTVDICAATDLPLGTIDNENALVDTRQTVFLLGRGPTKKVVAAKAIAVGDRVYTAAAGKVTDSPVAGCFYIGQAATAAGVDGDLIELHDNAPVKVPGSHEVIAAGVHDWAGGAATADVISVAGLEAGDIVIATLAARAATEGLVGASIDDADDEIDLTLSANGTDTTTKVAYTVLRPVA